MLVRKADGWISAKTDDAVLLMGIKHDVYLGLSPVGSRIWELLDAPRSIDELCAELVAEFDIDQAQCRAEVLEFLNDMSKRGVFVLSEQE
jgi:hypothetical protein